MRVASIGVLSVSLILVQVGTIMLQSVAQWRESQRSHIPEWLSSDELVKLSSLTNLRPIYTFLEHIMVQRQVGTPDHDIVAAYLKQKCEEFGFKTEWDSFYDDTPYGRKSFHNLIATFDPLVHRRLLLACHYDSKIIPGYVFLGATDSALPCALLLDIARTLGPLLHNRTNKHITLQLLFLDGEEAFQEWSHTDSIYGARHLANRWEKKWYPTTSGSSFELSRELDRVDVLVLLDLLGAKNPQIRNTFGHGADFLFETLPEIENRLRNLGQLKSIPQIFHPGTTLAAVEDDHIPFINRGIPTLHLISVPFPTVWHTPADNWSALDNSTIQNLASIMRVFTAQYLGVHSQLVRSTPLPRKANRQLKSRSQHQIVKEK